MIWKMSMPDIADTVECFSLEPTYSGSVRATNCLRQSLCAPRRSVSCQHGLARFAGLDQFPVEARRPAARNSVPA